VAGAKLGMAQTGDGYPWQQWIPQLGGGGGQDGEWTIAVGDTRAIHRECLQNSLGDRLLGIEGQGLGQDLAGFAIATQLAQDKSQPSQHIWILGIDQKRLIERLPRFWVALEGDEGGAPVVPARHELRDLN
jgi:hypothetical protein